MNAPDEPSEPIVSNAREAYVRAVDELAAHVNAFDDWEWSAVQSALLSATSLPMHQGTMNLLLDRVQVALLRDPEEELNFEHAITLIYLLRVDADASDVEMFRSQLDDSARRWVAILTRAFGDWLSDLLRGDLVGFKNWTRLFVSRTEVLTAGAPRTFVDLGIHLNDGSLLEMSMPLESTIRFMRTLANNLAEFPTEALGGVPPSVFGPFADDVSLLLSKVADAYAEASESSD